MATVTQWTPFGVALNLTATAGTITRTSATKYTVVINVSWECYWSSTKTNYGMSATSGGVTKTISSFGTARHEGSASFTGTYSISGNGSASKSITVTFKNYNTDNGDSASKSLTITVTVPAWTSYTVKYNANGGSGAPSQQTKWKGQTLKLSSTKPTRTGYSFQGWGTSASDTSVDYAAGASYTANKAITLYAIWQIITYSVTYNANGGSGAPSAQTKQYGKTLTLSSTIPTRTNYTFKGWGTSASATSVAYAAGGSYTANKAITLYAVWELSYVIPRITDFSVKRCGADGTLSSNGLYALVTFNWATDLDVTSVLIEWKLAAESEYTDEAAITATGKTGTVTQIIGAGELSTGSTYSVRATVADSNGSYSKIGTVSSLALTIHAKQGGNGIAFGKIAELDGVADIAYETLFRGGIRHPELEPETDLNDVTTPNTYIGANVTTYNYVNCPLDTGTFTLEVVGMGDEGQLKQRLTYCHKTASRAWERIYHSTDGVMSWGEWVCVSDFDGQLLWSGGYYMTASHTISLSEAISKQRSGIVLVFSRYSSSTVRNYHFNHFFVSKHFVAQHPGLGSVFWLSSAADFATIAAKYLYISDESITGNDINTATGEASGITYANNGFVLRYVIGV